MFEDIIAKIEQADIQTEPFRHLEIHDLFPADVFDRITSAPEIAFAPMASDRQLVDTLQDKGWKPIPFPGTTENVETYLRWREKGGKVLNTNTCEGFGITYRLYEIESDILRELNEFLQSDAFKNAIAAKFGVVMDDVTYDAGIQKYLDGYEISPHPDIRKKALTYMVNINPAPNSEQLEFHTHYMRFNPDKQYVGTYWAHNDNSERCWVPWDWCESVKQQKANNSMVIFAPSNDTLHAIRAHYDHLATQRTQLYGNFWYKQPAEITLAPEWEHYVITEGADANIKRRVPDFVKKPLKVLAGRSSLKAGKRAVRT